MITTAKQSSILQGFPKYRSMLAGNAAYNPAAFDSIATLNGDGSATSLTFNSIPQTYQHLQIRGIAHNASTGIQINGIKFNGTTGSNYASHYFAGNGASLFAGGTSGQTIIDVDVLGGNVATYPFVCIIDILDYASTSKQKPVKIIGGYEKNAAGGASEFNSGNYNSTNAITSITLTSNGNAFSTSSKIALYGIKVG